MSDGLTGWARNRSPRTFVAKLERLRRLDPDLAGVVEDMVSVLIDELEQEHQ